MWNNVEFRADAMWNAMSGIPFRQDARINSKKFQKLIDKIVTLEAHNAQLKNIIQKLQSSTASEDHKKSGRKFDFSKCHHRHILLKFLYLGWNYQGFAVQEDTTVTIEHHLFKALIKTCLIATRETSNYHRCGRTDKGVSAFSQVVSLDVRSKLPPEQQDEDLSKEMDYCSILNRVLPEDIRCIAWTPLQNPEFSARFDCKERTYRYYFPKANLDVEAMQKGCTFLLASHDFRNLCKMDVANGVTTFTRTINSAKVCRIGEEESPYGIYYLEIRSQAFLWHQIRCIVAVLLLIGQRLEEPEVIQQLLDVEKNPCKPQYSLASPLPLILYNCEFEDENGIELKWIYDQENLKRVIVQLQGQWCVENTKSSMLKQIIEDLEHVFEEDFKHTSKILAQASILEEGAKPKFYQTLLNRSTCQSLEERIDHFSRKRKLNDANDKNIKEYNANK